MGEHAHAHKSEDGHAVKRAIRKYGWENVRVITLETDLPAGMLDERERHYISACRSLVGQNGYNLTTGADAQPMNHPAVKIWHQRQMKDAMNRPAVRAKKSALWKDEGHKEMMADARLSFSSAEKRRKGFAAKRKAQITAMSVDEGIDLMLKVRGRIGKNSKTRRVTTPGQQNDALDFWQREWDEYATEIWNLPPQASSCESKKRQRSTSSKRMPSEWYMLASSDEEDCEISPICSLSASGQTKCGMSATVVDGSGSNGADSLSEMADTKG